MEDCGPCRMLSLGSSRLLRIESEWVNFQEPLAIKYTYYLVDSARACRRYPALCDHGLYIEEDVTGGLSGYSLDMHCSVTPPSALQDSSYRLKNSIKHKINVYGSARSEKKNRTNIINKKRVSGRMRLFLCGTYTYASILRSLLHQLDILCISYSWWRDLKSLILSFSPFFSSIEENYFNK